ncbi:tetratricopeptide repeat protein [Chlamydiota bacterium]
MRIIKSLLVIGLFFLTLFAAEENPFRKITSYEEAFITYRRAARLDDIEEKMKLFDKVLEFYFSQDPINYDRVGIVYRMKCITFLDKDKFNEFNNVLNEFQKSLPEKFEYIIKGMKIRENLQLRNLDEVIRLANKYIKEYPNKRLGYYMKGYALFLKEKYKKANETFDFILEKENDVNLLLYKGISEIENKKYDKGLKNIAFYISNSKLMPNSLPYYYKAIAYFHLGDYEKAKENIIKGRKINSVDLVELSDRNDTLFKEKVEKEIDEIEKKMQQKVD